MSVSPVTIFRVCDFISCILGVLSSLVLLLLIYDMDTKSSYIYLIWYMSIGQLSYFIFLGLNVCYTDMYTLETMWPLLLRSFFGVCSFFVSSIISFSIIYVLKYYKIFDIFKWKRLTIFASVGPNLLWLPVAFVAISKKNFDISLFRTSLQISTWLRIVPIFFNFGVFFYSKCLVSGMSNLKTKERKEERAILRLVDQIKWYPIGMAMSRICVTWYTFKYGYQPYVSFDDKFRFILYLCYIMGSSIAPISFLIIFLFMQRKALNHLKMRLRCMSIEEIKKLGQIQVKYDSSVSKDSFRSRDDKKEKPTFELSVKNDSRVSTSVVNPLSKEMSPHLVSESENVSSERISSEIHHSRPSEYIVSSAPTIQAGDENNSDSNTFDDDSDDDYETRITDVNLVRESSFSRYSTESRATNPSFRESDNLQP